MYWPEYMKMVSTEEYEATTVTQRFAVVIPPLVLDCLNVYWLTKIIPGLRKVLTNADWEK